MLLTAPAAVVIALIFPVRPPASRAQIAPFLLAVLASFLLMAAINFLIGTCAIPLKSILALIRAKFWLIELLSGLLIPISFFPHWAQVVSHFLPFEHIAYTPLQLYLGKLTGWAAWRAVGVAWAWVVAAARARPFLVGALAAENHDSRRLRWVASKNTSRLLGKYFAQYLKVRVSYRGDFLIGLVTSLAATLFSFGFVCGALQEHEFASRAGASGKSFFSTALP